MSVRPQYHDSGLVAREWVRTSRRRGTLTEWTLEGKQVSARFFERHGMVQEIAGKIARDDAGELVVESWAKRDQAANRRAASVDVLPAKR